MKTKIKSLILALTITVSSMPFSEIIVNAESGDYPVEMLYTDYYTQEIDWDLWDRFIKYDLCITDYDSLTDEKKELCRFIFETERSANGTVICERARRQLAGDTDLGERMTVEELDGLPGIYDKYYTENVHGDNYYTYNKYYYKHCVPDLCHDDGDVNFNEYWLDETGSKRILSWGTAAGFTYYPDYAYCEFNEETLEWSIEKITRNDIDIEPELINIDGINYTILPNNTASIVNTDFGNSESAITEPIIIPDEINGYPVTSIEMSAFGATKVTEVHLPDTITYIGPMAFNGCEFLETIELSEELIFFGEYMFSGCSSLTYININCPKLTLTAYSFQGTGLISADICVKKIDEWSFRSCNYLETVTFHEGVEEIAANAFAGCQSLKNINFPSTLKSIGQGAFTRQVEEGDELPSTHLYTITIPDTVEIIGALPETQGLIEFSAFEPIPATDPLTDEPVCVFDSDCIINGYYNTEAHRYALEWGLKFNPLDEDITYGDINLDGEISVADAVLLQSKLVGKDVSVGYEADLAKDGIIDVFDMIEMRIRLISGN